MNFNRPSPAKRLSLALTVIGLMFTTYARGDDWPKWRGPTGDGVWREKGIIDKFEKPQMDYVWRTPIGSGYSGPTVAKGRVYITDRVRKPKQVERVHCLEEKTGKRIWTHVYDCDYRDVGYDAGPRASVLINNGRAYSLGTMGDLFCFDAIGGNVMWHKNLAKEYNIRMPIWGIAASPVIAGNLIIVQIGGEPDACLVAFDKITGEERWRALSDNASYVAPKLIYQAGKSVLVVKTGERIVGLNPQTGEVHWKLPHPPKQMIIGIADPVIQGDKMFFTTFFDGSLMIQIDQKETAAYKVWQRAGPSEKDTLALHSIISTPYFKGEYIYGCGSYGELRCLNAATGERVWESQEVVPKARWATFHFIEHEDDVWLFNEKGELIISKLSPEGYTEISRTKLIEPTLDQLNRRGGVTWSHPAFANKHVFARNDKEIVCASLAK